VLERSESLESVALIRFVLFSDHELSAHEETLEHLTKDLAGEQEE